MARSSSVESSWVRSGTRKVAWMMSNRRMGSTPCAMKKGECLVDLWVVARSAQKAKGVTVSQLESLLLHALKMDLRMVRCCLSTILFTCELYAEMQM